MGHPAAARLVSGHLGEGARCVALPWWHNDLDIDRETAVQRTHAATATALKDGRRETDGNSVSFSSARLQTTVACLPGRRGGTQVIVIAAGDDGDRTLGVLRLLRDRVPSGGRSTETVQLRR